LDTIQVSRGQARKAKTEVKIGFRFIAGVNNSIFKKPAVLDEGALSIY
jgi:hypothetical protein